MSERSRKQPASGQDRGEVEVYGVRARARVRVRTDEVTDRPVIVFDGPLAS